MIYHSLSIVNYHHISDEVTCFDNHLSMRTGVDLFAQHLEYYKKYHTAVSLDQLLSGDLPSNAVMITFDDGYASVFDNALPLLRQYDFPAVSFVIGDTVFNQRLPIDNLFNYCTETFGLAAVKHAIGLDDTSYDNMGDLIYNGLSSLPADKYSRIRERLCTHFDLDETTLFQKQRLFMNVDELIALQNSGIEIGNHSMDHAFYRQLDKQGCQNGIGETKARLDAALPKPIRAFAYPYGSSDDDTPTSRAVLRKSGHEAIFLVENRSNRFREDDDIWFRVAGDNRPVEQLHREMLYQWVAGDTKGLLKSFAAPVRRLYGS